MKISYLTLHNFASIYVGMKLKKLHIDLSSGYNVIILLVGPNGSGKTSILSNLHPFAYPGTMDVRSGTELILEGHDGYKEVGIENNGDSYVVKHFYMFKNKNRTMKSFISKNGVEMNPNGNVTSFMEVVELELGLEPEFLKLLRLGSNVTSFINMKSLDRKKFTSQLLADVDIYSSYYKKVNDDTRAFKALIKSATEKMSRLNISDLKQEQREQEKLLEYMNQLSDNRDMLMVKMGEIQSSIQSLEVESISDLNLKILECDNVIKTMERQLKNLEKTIEKLGGMTIEEAQKEKEILTEKYNEIDKELSLLTMRNEMGLNELNMLFEQKDSKESNLKFIDSSQQINKLKDFKNEINEEIKELLSELSSFEGDFTITKQEALTILSMLDDLRYVILDILSVSPKNEIEEFFKYADKNIKSVMRKKIEIIDKQMLVVNMELSKDINEYGKNELQVMYRLCEHSECPYVAYYNNTSSKVVTKKEELQSRLSKLDSQRTFYGNIVSIDEYMGNAKYILNLNSALIKASPFSKYIGHELITRCLKSKSNDPIDEVAKLVTEYISNIEIKYEIDEKRQAIENTDREIEMFEKNSKTLDIIKSEIDDILNRINEVNLMLSENGETIKKLNCDLIDIDNRIYDLNSLIESNDTKKDTLTVIEITNKEKESVTNTIKQYQELQDVLSKINLDLIRIQQEHQSKKALFDTNSRRISDFITLQDELKTLNESYDELEILKETLSSNKGIPLLYIQLYLRSTRKFINELLDVVYGGNLQIETFIVNEKEFRIPYTKNGVLVDDVVYASDGERAFISLIMSLALIKQSIKKYNILLLDEVDGALDAESRVRFLGILERYIKEIGCEQLFMITHNNAFDNYDIDLIVTGNTDVVDNLRKVNSVIFKR